MMPTCMAMSQYTVTGRDIYHTVGVMAMLLCVLYDANMYGYVTVL